MVKAVVMAALTIVEITSTTFQLTLTRRSVETLDNLNYNLDNHRNNLDNESHQS
jgi:hypothetical protein